LKTKVKKVNIETGIATGVTLDDKVLNADAVIVAQETISAVNNLFDITFSDEWIKEILENTKPTVCTFVSIGVRAKLPDMIPEWKLDSPITYAGQKLDTLSFYSHNEDNYALENCTVLTTGLMSDTYDFWKKAKDEGRYEDEKKALADQICEALCKKYPQAEGHIDIIDIATPLTYERYTSAYRGSWMTEMVPGDKMKTHSGVVKDVQGLYFAGHRLIPPGGLPAAAASGRTAAQHVCRQFDVEFI
jgi:phytoene dehydrogenase-like protein